MNRVFMAAAIPVVGIVTVAVTTAAAAPLLPFQDMRSGMDAIWQAPGDNDTALGTRDTGDSDIDTPDARQTPEPVPGTRQAGGAPGSPGSVLDLRNWYLTLPTGPKGDPDTVQPGELTGYSSPYMRLNGQGDGVVFTAHAGGATTENSQYPRSELREMDGNAKASWDGNSGRHVMEIRQAVTKLPAQKPEVAVGQIHGTSDDLMQIHLSGSKLTVKYDDGSKKVPLDDNYQLGRVFTVRIESSAGRVKVWYDGVLKADLPISSSTSYFKAGNYLQTNTSKGDAADATAEVVIYALTVTHE